MSTEEYIVLNYIKKLEAIGDDEHPSTLVLPPGE